MDSYFPPLNLPFDADERAVKRAYAAALKTARPDDDPAAFQALVTARDRALVWVRQRGESRRVDMGRAEVARVEATTPTQPPAEPAASVAPAAEPAPPATASADDAAPPHGERVDRLTLAETVSSGAPTEDAVALTGPAGRIHGPPLTEPRQPKPAPTPVPRLEPEDPPAEFRDTAPVYRVLPTPPDTRPPLPGLAIEAARARHLSLRFLIDFAIRLTGADDVTDPARWNDLFEAAEELDLAGRLALERTIAVELDEAIRRRPWLNPADSLALAAVVARIDAHFGWSSDVRRLVRILGEPSGAHPLVFAVERFGEGALKLRHTPGGFPIIASGDLDAYFGRSGRATVRLYNRSADRGSVGPSWSSLAFLAPTAWLAGIGRPWAALAITAFAVAVVLAMFEPIGDVWTANAYVTFLAVVVLTRMGLAVAARPLEIASLARLLRDIDGDMPTLIERRRRIGTARSGGRIPSMLAGLVFLVLVDGYALGLVIEGFTLPSTTVAAMLGPSDRTTTSVSFAERLVAQSFIDKAHDLLRSIEDLAADPTLVPKSPRALRIEALKTEIRHVVTTVPIGGFAPVFAELQKRVADLKRKG